MRLIDADYVTEKLNGINGTAELDKAFEVVENAPTVDVLDKIRAEIDRQQKWLLQAGHTAYNVDIAFDAIKLIVAESEE